MKHDLAFQIAQGLNTQKDEQHQHCWHPFEGPYIFIERTHIKTNQPERESLGQGTIR